MIFTISICIALYYMLSVYITAKFMNVNSKETYQIVIDWVMCLIFGLFIAPFIIIILGWQKLHETL